MKTTRAALLGAASAIALVGLPLMRSFVEAAEPADPSDVATLAAALALERAALKAYGDGAATGLLAPATLRIAAGFVADHTAHRDALSAAIAASGATPGAAVATIPYPPLHTEADVLRFALTIERKAAATYLSVVADFKDRKLAEVAAAILGCETTHVALLSNALGERAYPSGFVA